MRARLFVYGTLRKGHAPPEIADAVAQLEPLGKGVARGQLYDLGAYPGAVFESGPNAAPIEGEVYAVPDERALRALDTYEGYIPDDPEESLFLRLQIEVRMAATGDTAVCWAYQYNQPIREPAVR
jgi:gamma-glutamylcyclotransferase (GGCT)/AIG2-like uncharacterized protein YtfP